MTKESEYSSEYKSANTDADDKTLHYARCIKRLFSSDEGKAVLDLWRENYLEAPVLPIHENENFGRTREGQNTLIREVLHLLKGDIS